MQKFLRICILMVLVFTYSLSSVEAARTRTRTPAPSVNMVQQPVYYGSPYTINNGTTTQTYYFSPTYQQ